MKDDSNDSRSLKVPSGKAIGSAIASLGINPFEHPIICLSDSRWLSGEALLSLTGTVYPFSSSMIADLSRRYLIIHLEAFEVITEGIKFKDEYYLTKFHPKAERAALDKSSSAIK